MVASPFSKTLDLRSLSANGPPDQGWNQSIEPDEQLLRPADETAALAPGQQLHQLIGHPLRRIDSGAERLIHGIDGAVIEFGGRRPGGQQADARPLGAQLAR